MSEQNPTKLPSRGEISTAVQIWQTAEPGSEGEREAASRMADVLMRIRRSLPPSLCGACRMQAAGYERAYVWPEDGK